MLLQHGLAQFVPDTADDHLRRLVLLSSSRTWPTATPPVEPGQHLVDALDLLRCIQAMALGRAVGTIRP